jgi:2-polyprenyl-3-methyl-5-hydroxy-6-metoxy-1,4-benzoquinol methylase
LTETFSVRDYWESRLRQSYSPEGVGYRRLGRQYNTWMYRVRARVFARVARSLGVDWRTATVLDIGSGTGFYVDQWHQLGVPRVTGVDITDKAVDELRRHFTADEFVRADIGQPLDPASLSLLPAPFDAASAMDVLFHIVDDAEYARAFENLASLLRPGGWFLWSDNFLRHHTERVAHQVSRTLADSERLVRAAGFEVVRRVPMFVLMNYPADSRGKVARWAWTAMVAPAAIAEPLGWALGAILAPIDGVLTRIMHESPTTEIMVCRKV